jgi:hypothetical protein
MSRINVALSGLLLVLIVFGGAGTHRLPAGDDEGWVPLFNGENLDGWYTWLPSTGKNDDPKGVFRVHDGMIHVLDVQLTDRNQEFGYIATEKEYSRYRLRFEYKWGAKRFPPRQDAKRDSGVLYHFVGPDKVWPRSIECQVQEGDTGDFWLVDGTTVSTTVAPSGAKEKRYQKDGATYTQTNGRIVKSETHDLLTDWNTVEVVVQGADEVVHLVGGKVNNHATDLLQPDPDDPSKTIPLAKGRILFQAEGAEVYYRNIEIKLLD